MKLGSLRLAAAGMAVAAVSIFPSGTLTAAADGGVTKPYILPIGDFQEQADCTHTGTGPGGAILNWGGVCFTVQPGQKITLAIADASPLPVGASYLFNNSKDMIQGIFGDPTKFQKSGTFCGTLKDFTVPDGSDQVWIAIGVINQDQEAAFNQDTSIGCGAPSPGSIGSVTATGAGAVKSPAPAPAPVQRRAGVTRTASRHLSAVAVAATTNRVVGHARLI